MSAVIKRVATDRFRTSQNVNVTKHAWSKRSSTKRKFSKTETSHYIKRSKTYLSQNVTKRKSYKPKNTKCKNIKNVNYRKYINQGRVRRYIRKG